MIDHVTFGVVDIDRSKRFYDLALAPLGVTRLFNDVGEGGKFSGYGDQRPWFWITDSNPTTGRLHIAISASSPEVVDDFYRAALEAGGQDNGAPGLRPHYHPGYYGAFVLDPDGHNIEAVFHGATFG